VLRENLFDRIRHNRGHYRQTVSVFISSTFNDMHTVRDYLVKRVFPELRAWCEKRKPKLIDIDLRGCVTEEEQIWKKL
jgi:hypothetical protein